MIWENSGMDLQSLKTRGRKYGKVRGKSDTDRKDWERSWGECLRKRRGRKQIIIKKERFR